MLAKGWLTVSVIMIQTEQKLEFVRFWFGAISREILKTPSYVHPESTLSKNCPGTKYVVYVTIPASVIKDWVTLEITTVETQIPVTGIQVITTKVSTIQAIVTLA